MLYLFTKRGKRRSCFKPTQILSSPPHLSVGERAAGWSGSEGDTWEQKRQRRLMSVNHQKFVKSLSDTKLGEKSAWFYTSSTLTLNALMRHHDLRAVSVCLYIPTRLFGVVVCGSTKPPIRQPPRPRSQLSHWTRTLYLLAGLYTQNLSETEYAPNCATSLGNRARG